MNIGDEPMELITLILHTKGMPPKRHPCFYPITSLTNPSNASTALLFGSYSNMLCP